MTDTLRFYLARRRRNKLYRYQQPRHVHIITRDIGAGIRLYWCGQTLAGRERWSHRSSDAARFIHLDAAQAAVRGCNLPKDSLILRVKL